MNRPIIGITADHREEDGKSKYVLAAAYSQAVAACGGMPVLLPHEPKLAHSYVAWCDGLLLPGGKDADTRRLARSEPMHPRARPVDPGRQEFEMALLDAVDEAEAGKNSNSENSEPEPEITNLRSELSDSAAKPPACLGVCLGMQMMALHAGGRLNQYLPDTHRSASIHANNQPHPLVIADKGGLLPHPGEHDLNAQTVISSHQQAIDDAGAMRVIATASDEVIEAVDVPGRAFYLGVQWHPERGGEGSLSLGLIRQLVQAASARDPRQNR